MICHAVPCFAMLCQCEPCTTSALLCHAMPCCAMLSYTTFACQHHMIRNLCCCLQRIVRSSWEKPCIVAKNVADYFLAKVDAEQSESHRAQKDQLQHYQNWLQALRTQVCEYLPQQAYTLTDPALIEATDLLKLLIIFKDSAWAAYQADMAQLGHARLDSIRGIHDATMLCCLFGWVPPMRVSMLISLLKPDLKHECLQQNCNCAGNFLHYQSKTQLGVSWHHHKTARKQGGVAITYALPEELNTMFHILLDPANRKLLASKDQVDRTVFLTTTGKELSMGTWGHYFDKLTTKMGKPLYSEQLPAQLPFSKCLQSASPAVGWPQGPSTVTFFQQPQCLAFSYLLCMCHSKGT